MNSPLVDLQELLESVALFFLFLQITVDFGDALGDLLVQGLLKLAPFMIYNMHYVIC